MNQEKILYLHIGLPKTGTSSIQQYLKESRDELGKRGILYPEPLVRRGHHAEALLLLREMRPDAVCSWSKAVTKMADKNQGRLLHILKTFDDELNCLSSSKKILILSSESIFGSFKSPSELVTFKNFFPEYTIKVILYIRRIDRWVASSIMQHAKYDRAINEPMIEEIKSSREKGQLQLIEKLELWGGMVGQDNIIVRPFERKQLKNSDVVADFMGIIDSSYEVKESRPENNIVISLECAHFLAKTVTFPAFDRSGRDKFISSTIIASDHLRKISCYNGAVLSPKMNLSLLENMFPVYQKVARDYLGREDGRLFLEPLPSSTFEREVFPGLSFENAKPIYDEVINSLYQKLQDKENKLALVRNEKKSLKKELKITKDQLLNCFFIRCFRKLKFVFMTSK